MKPTVFLKPASQVCVHDASAYLFFVAVLRFLGDAFHEGLDLRSLGGRKPVPNIGFGGIVVWHPRTRIQGVQISRDEIPDVFYALSAEVTPEIQTTLDVAK